MTGPRAAIASLAEDARDSERTVLGSLFLDPSLLPSLKLTGTDFSLNHHKIFDAMLGVFIGTQSFDPYLVTEELRRRGQYWEGAAVYVSSLTDGMPRHVALEGHCERIRGCAVRRKLARLCEETLAGCHDATAGPRELLERHRAVVISIDAERSKCAGDDLGLVCAADVKPETAEFLIEPYIPRRCLSLLVGDPGDGKTWIGLSLAAGLTRGLIPFAGPCARASVLYLSNEDGAGELRARFDRIGGDPSRIWFESADRTVNLSQAPAIEAAVQKHGASLIVVDTITSHFGAQADFHKANEVAALLGPLAAIAQRTGAALLGLMHLSKSMQGKSLYRVQGSTAFAGAARSVLAVGRDPSDPSKRILAHLKVNGSAEGSSRTFSIDGNGVAWGAVSELRAADVLGPETSSEDRGELSAAVEFLRDALSNGSRDASEVKSEAKHEGISEITLKRAKAHLGVKSRKKSMNAGWLWWLAEGDQEVDQSCLPP